MKQIFLDFVIALSYFTTTAGSYVESANSKLSPRSVTGGKCFNKANPPPSTICGEAGKFHLPLGALVRLSNAQTASVDTCRDYCLSANSPDSKAEDMYIECQSFSYNTTNTPGVCILYGDALNKTTFRSVPGYPLKFYSKDCFYCDRQCPIPVSEGNLLNNPGFDISTSQLGPWRTANSIHGSRRIIPGGGETGSNALRIRGQNRIYQQIGLCPDQNYLLSMRYKAESQNASIDCVRDGSISFGDGEMTLLPSYGLNEWLTAARSAVVSGTDQVLFTGSPTPKCSILIDSMSVKAIRPPQTLKTIGKSLIQNGGFETGKIAPFSITILGSRNFTSKVVPSGLGPSGGSFHYQFNCTHAEYQTDYSYKFIQVIIKQTTSTATKVNETYVLTFDYRLTHDSNFFLVSLDDSKFTWQTGPLDHDKGAVRTFSRIFSGTGKPVALEIVAERVAFVETPKAPFPAKVEIDNVSIYQRAE